MPRGTAPYPPEFRAEAVRLARQPGHSTREVTRDLGIGNETLRRWVIQARWMPARPRVSRAMSALSNPHRRHSAIGYLSPAEFERRYRSETIAA